ncbi:MAG: hypothetical protein RLW87_20710 [Alphaproteobacteria bacterium]
MPFEIVPDDGSAKDRKLPLKGCQRQLGMTAKARRPVIRGTARKTSVSEGVETVALSPAEIALVRLMVEKPELPIRGLAEGLKVSPRTIEKRQRTITRKCGAASFAGAVARLLTRGWSDAVVGYGPGWRIGRKDTGRPAGEAVRG